MSYTGKLYEIALPALDNAGKSYANAHMEYRRFLLMAFGGYTKAPTADGAWRDPATGRIYRDKMTSYRILWPCTDMPNLIDKAFELFPDQVALFVSEIGTAEIVPRPQRKEFKYHGYAISESLQGAR